jgi:hypothetical protein
MLARQALLPLGPLYQSFLVLGIMEIGSLELFPRVGLKLYTS